MEYFQEWQTRVVARFDALLDERADSVGGKKAIRERLGLSASFFGECRRKARAGRIPLEKIFEVILHLNEKPGLLIYEAACDLDEELLRPDRPAMKVEDFPPDHIVRKLLGETVS